MTALEALLPQDNFVFLAMSRHSDLTFSKRGSFGVEYEAHSSCQD